jgi:hypothetical protein
MHRTCLLLCVLWASPLWAIDAFDRHTTSWLREAVKEKEPLTELSSGQAAAWKLLGPGVEGPCVVVRTSGGHWTKALLSWGLRKSGDERVSVLVIDRYVTYDNDRRDVALAAGKNVMLFPGFYFNFEIGQVVPEGQGGDVLFTAAGKLQPAGSARLFGLDGSALPPADKTRPDPLDHEGVLPRDFSGTWHVNADGRWRGLLQLSVTDEGSLQGSYTSEESQSVYPVTGRVSGAPHRAALEVELANTVQSFEAFLWTKDKSTMAGTTLLADRKFGFYALRVNEEAHERGKK